MNSSVISGPSHNNIPPLGVQDVNRIDEKMLIKLVKDLLSLKDRENALAELSKNRESIDNLAVVLWNTFGIFKICS